MRLVLALFLITACSDIPTPPVIKETAEVAKCEEACIRDLFLDAPAVGCECWRLIK